jgi:mRNA interferase RelE/StbE
LAWTLEFVPDAAKELKKLGRAEAGRIIRTLEDRIACLENPRTLGAPLTGDHAGYWRWRVGDYRIVAQIEDERVRILVIRIGHRREVYR